MKKLNEEKIVSELLKNSKWYEIIIIKLFRNIFIKIYRKGMQDYFNIINKN